MAGRNQAVNLTGMLSQMGQSLREGYTVDGRMAGDAFAETALNNMAPELDMSNPDSIDQYADYLRRTGKPQEAIQLQEQARKLREQQGAMQRMDGMFNIANKANAAAGVGDVTGLNREIAQLNKLAGEAQTLEEKNMYGRQLRDLQAQREPAKDIRVQRQSDLLLQYDQVMEDQRIPQDVKDRLETQRAELMGDPQIAESYNTKKLEAIKQENAMYVQQQAQAAQQLQQPFDNVYGTAGYDTWAEQQREAGYGTIVDALERKKMQQEEDELRLANLRSEAEAAKTPLDIGLLDSITERIAATNLPEQQQAGINTRLTTLRTEMEELNKQIKNGNAPPNVRKRRSDIAKELNQYFTMVNNASYNQDMEGQVMTEAMQRELVDIESAIAKVSIPNTRIVSRAMSLVESDNKEDIYEEKTFKTAEGSEITMTAYEYAERLLLQQAVGPLVARRDQLISDLDKGGKPSGLEAWIAEQESKTK